MSNSAINFNNIAGSKISKSLVTAKGDILTASAPATPAVQSIGSHGQIPFVDSSQANGWNWKDPTLRNWFMNGNCEVAQRGTSWTNPATGSYNIDRIKSEYASDGGTFPTVVISQQSLTPGDLLNSFYFHRVNVDGAGSSLGNNSYYREAHYIEHGTRNLCGLNKKITLSIQARSSIANKKIGIAVIQNYGTGGSPSSQEVLINTASGGKQWIMTSSFAKTDITFSTNTLVGKTFGTNNNDALIVYIYYQWGLSYDYIVGGGATAETFVGAGNIDIAQVALYAGDVAYPFEPKPYSQELFDCQYYCQVYDSIDDTFKVNIITGYDIHFQKQLLRPMRIKPICTFLGTENTDYLVTNLNGTPQSGFTFNINSYTNQKSLYVIASKVSHGLTDARFIFSATGKIIADADF